MEPLTLPKDFLMGTASSALQIEGGDRNNNWYRWCQEGHIRDGSHCVTANDHWNRWREDINLMRELHHDTCRMGLEWSRIEPEEGRFSREGIDHYRAEVEELLKSGIKPLITLHHFSHPLWLEDMGGWENPKAPELFNRYTRFVVENLGDLVSDWITINEPNVFLTYGYSDGLWPPGKKDIRALFRAAKNIIHGHIKSYRTIHQIREDRGFDDSEKTLVGVAHHLRIFDPVEENPLSSLLNKFSARLLEYSFQNLFLEGMAWGIFKFPLGMGGYPAGKGRFFDFLGINYYSRDMVKFAWNPARMFGKLTGKEGAPVNDLGWEIYPDGLYRLCRDCYRRYRTPIFITENGIADEKDEKRPHFIYDHLKQISRLIDEDIPVRRYYHWTLIDNFEWLEGESSRFGLIHNDYRTQKRTIRRSGLFYGEICRQKAVTREMIEKYLQHSL
jgi:beta-glucosidase